MLKIDHPKGRDLDCGDIIVEPKEQRVVQVDYTLVMPNGLTIVNDDHELLPTQTVKRLHRDREGRVIL